MLVDGLLRLVYGPLHEFVNITTGLISIWKRPYIFVTNFLRIRPNFHVPLTLQIVDLRRFRFRQNCLHTSSCGEKSVGVWFISKLLVLGEDQSSLFDMVFDSVTFLWNNTSLDHINNQIRLSRLFLFKFWGSVSSECYHLGVDRWPWDCLSHYFFWLNLLYRTTKHMMKSKRFLRRLWHFDRVFR